MNFSNDIQTCWMDKFYIKKISNFQIPPWIQIMERTINMNEQRDEKE